MIKRTIIGNVIVAQWSLIPILLLLSVLLIVGRADTFGDFTCFPNGSTVGITKYNGNGGNVTIPDAIGGKQVVAIGDSAFMNCGVLTGIIIPDGVHTIGYSTCLMCSKLTSLLIGNGVTNIAGSAFASCSNLASVDIPSSVLKVGTYAFADCTALTNLTISAGVSSIDEKAFVGCTKLRKRRYSAIAAGSRSVRLESRKTVASKDSPRRSW